MPSRLRTLSYSFVAWARHRCDRTQLGPPSLAFRNGVAVWQRDIRKSRTLWLIERTDQLLVRAIRNALARMTVHVGRHDRSVRYKLPREQGLWSFWGQAE